MQIKKLRERLGLTQPQLADAMGVTVQAVSKWERGFPVKSGRLPDLADVLHCSIDALFGREPTDPADYEAS